MGSRLWRFALVILLVASGAAATLSTWRASRQLGVLDRAQRELTHRVDSLLALLDAVTEPAGVEAPRDPRLMEQLRAESDALRPHVRSIEAGRTVQTFAGSAATLQDIDTRAQEHLRLGQDLMAADLIASEGRPAKAAAAAALRIVRTAENDAYAVARADVLDSWWTVSGAVAGFWVLGVILLMRTPRARNQEPPAPALSSHSLLITPEPSLDTVPEAPRPDLEAAADVCTAIGRMTSAEDLPRLLQRAATVLDASGIVVWMAAGDELFAAAAFGYPTQVIRKLGPINRSAVNATAAAWRTGALQAVSGDHGQRGAFAAPILGPDRCIGVLAVEVGAGRDSSTATRAVTMMFAAQLAAALAGWPAASAAAPLNVPPLDQAAEA